MDTVQIECDKLAKDLKAKYELNSTQSEELDRAIVHYDYLQNDGTIFTSTMDILECFMDLEDYENNQPITPDKNTIYERWEYIIKTIKFYDLPTMKIKSQANIKAMEIMKGGE